MRKTFRRKTTTFLFAFLLIIQAIIGIFLPFDFSFKPPYLETNKASAASENWYDSNYAYRRAITIDHDQVATTTDAFPILATTTQDYLKTETNGGKVQSDSKFRIRRWNKK